MSETGFPLCVLSPPDKFMHPKVKGAVSGLL